MANIYDTALAQSRANFLEQCCSHICQVKSKNQYRQHDGRAYHG